MLFAPNLAEQISKRLSGAALGLWILVILVMASGAAGVVSLLGRQSALMHHNRGLEISADISIWCTF